jgi:hypothetical protein
MKYTLLALAVGFAAIAIPLGQAFAADDSYTIQLESLTAVDTCLLDSLPSTLQVYVKCSASDPKQCDSFNVRYSVTDHTIQIPAMVKVNDAMVPSDKLKMRFDGPKVSSEYFAPDSPGQLEVVCK